MLALIKAMAEKEKQPEPEPSPKKAKTENIFDVLMNSGESRFECVRVKEGHQDMLCDQVTDAISDSCLAEDPKSKEKCASATKDNKDAAMDEIATQGSNAASSTCLAPDPKSKVKPKAKKGKPTLHFHMKVQECPGCGFVGILLKWSACHEDVERTIWLCEPCHEDVEMVSMLGR